MSRVVVRAGGTGHIAAPAPSQDASPWVFWTVSALLFVVSTAVTITWCESMSAMGGMVMPGGWIMSMAWMRMPGQSWPGAAGAFMGMWEVMMLAMMLPAVMPMLWRYRHAVARTGRLHLDALTMLVGSGYLAVWTLFGVAVFPLGVALATSEMHHPQLSRAVPIASGAIILIAGCLQLTPWKTRQLSCCRGIVEPSGPLAPDAGTAWRHGLRLGWQCARCCYALMAILLVSGVMDLRMMAVVAAAITLERLAPSGERIAQLLGVISVGVGAVLIARVVGT